MTKRINFFDGFISETTPDTVIVSASGIIGNWQGAWVSQDYVQNDAVYFNGSAYICILDTTASQDPTDNTYWELAVLKGESLAPDESDDLDEAKVSTIEALPNISPLDRYILVVENDNRANQALPAGISGDMSLRLIAWDGTDWHDFGQFTGNTGATGATGATGPQGPQGLQGAQGEGLEPGGTTGQLLIKDSATDYDVSWTDTISGNKTFSNDLTVDGNLTVNGTTTTVNTATLDVEDANITINKNGDQASADAADAGMTVEMSDATNAIIGYDSTLTSKFKAGEIGSEEEIITSGHSQTVTNKTIDANNNTITNLEHGSEVDDPSTGVHGVTGTIVGTSDSQTLTNKTIDGDLNTISNLVHGSEVDNPSSGVHGVTGNILGDTDTQTITNKTIDADNNTISNLVHGAEVDNPSSGVHGVTGNVVGTTDTQTLTNKTISGASIETPSRLDVKQDTLANLTTYAASASNGQFVFATDTKVAYQVIDNALEPIGSGGGSGGELNFYTNGDIEESEAIDFTTGNDPIFDDAGATALVGTFTITETISEVLRGLKSAKYVGAASNQDDFIASPLINIPLGYRGELLQVKIRYTWSGSDDNIKWVIKDETNNAILYENLTLKAESQGVDAYAIFFCPSNCEQIIIGPQLVADDTGTLIWDDVIVNNKLEGVSKDLTESQFIKHRADGNTLSDRNGEIRFNIANLTSTGQEFLQINDNAGSTRTEFIALIDCTVDVSIGFVAQNTTSNAGIVIDGTTVDFGNQPNSTGMAQTSTSINMLAGEVLTVAAVNQVGALSGTVFSNASPCLLNIVATATSPNLISSVEVPENEFSARITNADVVTSENIDGWITGVTSGVTGTYVIDTTDANFTVIPAYDAIAETASLYPSITSESTTSCTIEFRDDTGALTDTDFVFKASRQGDDYKNLTSSVAHSIPKTVYIKDIKASGSNGGTFTSGSYQTRTLNTLQGDTSFTGLSSNQFTLPAGTYEIEAMGACVRVNENRLRVQNITDSSTAILGDNHYNGSTSLSTNALLKGQITITGTKTFELQHRCGLTYNTFGFGYGLSFGDDETFATIKITKIK